MPATLGAWIAAAGAAVGSTGIIAYSAQIASFALQAAAVVGMSALSASQRRKAARAARAAYNASLTDRTQTVRGAIETRQLIMGKVRTGGVLAAIGTYGANKEYLSMVIALASHECEGIDEIYFNDDLVTLDGSGYVTSAPYFKTRTESSSESITLTGGSGSVVLPHVPIAGTAVVTIDLGGTNGSDSVAGSIAGSTVSVTGFGTHTGTGTVHYDYTTGTSKARVRWMLGDSAQAAFPDLITHFPSDWTTDHRLRGVTYLVVELDYDQDVFSSGVPNVSAVVRGTNEVYDTRTLTTGYSENPAMLMRWFALHPLGGRRVSAQLDESSIIAAANVCDTAVDYGAGSVALYTAGLTARTDQTPASVLDELAEAMAGRWGYSNGQLRVRGGAMGATVAAITADWLTGEGVNIQPRRPRGELSNIVQGVFVDSEVGYKIVQFPRVVDTASVTEDGAELVQEVEYAAITRSGQAQQVSTVSLRDARQSLTVSIVCNMRAYPLQVFDIVSLTLDRFGWSTKLFEVLERSYTHGGGIRLLLKETAAASFVFGGGFSTIDAAPNTNLPTPWLVPTVGALTVTSNTAELQDGSIVTRTHISWPAVADEGVTNGGFIEVGFVDASQPAQYSVVRANALTEHLIIGLRLDVHYLFKARAVNGAGVRGDWSDVVSHQIDGPSAGAASGQTLTLVATGFAFIYDSEAATSSTSPTIGFEALLQNITGTVVFAAEAFDVSNASLGAVTLSSVTATTCELTEANFNALGGGTGTRYVKVSATLSGLTDRMTVYRGDDGSSALNMRLGNEAHTVTTAADGSAGDYSSANTTVKMYEGITDVTSLWSFSRADTGCTSLINGVAGPVTGTGSVTVAVSAMSTDNAKVDITATRSGYPTQTGVFSLSKSKAGAAGDKYAIVFIYQRAASTPPLPTSTTTYDFATKTPAGMNNGWAATIPAGSNPLYVTAATASGSGASDTIASGEWAAATILAQDGIEGAKSASVFIYRRTTTSSTPSLPTTTTTYTFATGVASGMNNSWTTTVPSAAGGAYLWVTTATALSTGASDTIGSGEWAAPQLMAQDGTGSPGATGDSARIAYALYTGNPTPSGSSVGVVGTPPAGLPSVGSWGFATAATAWTVGAQTPSAGQSLFQSMGTYNPATNTTTWTVPFLSNFRVGSLSAITADLGTITAGSISTTGYLKAEGNTGVSLLDPESGGTASRTVCVVGNLTGTQQIGVAGISTHAGLPGVYGYNTSTGNGTGVFGYAHNGVRGKALPAKTNAVGVLGEAGSGSSSAGVVGFNNGSGTYGVRGATSFAGAGTAMQADATSGGTALQVIGVSTFSGRLTSTLSGNNTPLVLPIVTAKPAAIAGGVCLHNTLGLIFSDGANWYGPSGGVVTV